MILDCSWDQSAGLNNNPDFEQLIICDFTVGQGDLFVIMTSNSIMNFGIAPCQFKINYGNSQSN